MAGRFPELDLGRRTSGDVYAPNPEADVPAAFSQISHAAESFGAAVTGLAEDAARKEGADQAARDIAAGQANPTGGTSIRAQAYDQVADNFLLTQRKAALSDGMAQAFEANPDNPAALAKAFDAAHTGLQRTGRPLVDAAVDGQFLLLRSDYMARAFHGAKLATDAQAKANFLSDLNTGQQTLDQLAAGASYDAGGAKRVASGVQAYVLSLAKYGPKEAFKVGGVDLPADATRSGAMTPAEIEQFVQRGVSQARKTWVISYADALPNEAARRAYAKDVEAKWKAGDPMFAGLDGADMVQLQAHLEASADRLHAETRQAQTEAAQHARDAIEAFTWGQDVDFDAALANAKASGDAGLEAQVRFYKDADPQTRGVLRTVVARQLGLLGNTGPGEVVVDATGQPVASADADAAAAAIRPDPAGYFGKILGGPVEITSAQRSAAHNAEIPGASPTSAHIPGLAWDFKPPPGMTTAEAVAKLRQSGVPFDQVLDEHTHVHFGLGPKMRGQVLIRDGNAWSTPPDVKPGTPAYVAWASAREGFSTDPLNYVRGGQNRPAIASVPVMVPDGAFADGAAAQAWAQAFSQRYSLGQALAQRYGVPPRILTNGERDAYAAQIKADPMRGIALAQAARAAGGAPAALRLMRELGETDYEATAALHIADLAAGGSAIFARAAAQGLQLQAESKGAKLLQDTDAQQLQDVFDKAKGLAPPPVWTAALTTARAAMIADGLAGRQKDASYYLNSALGMTSVSGRLYGGPAEVNGGRTVLPRWLAPAYADDALRTLGDLWHDRGNGPVWANHQLVTGEQLGHMQPILQANGTYRFVNPRTGNPLMGQSGRPFEVDLDQARGFIAQRFGPQAVRPETGGD